MDEFASPSNIRWTGPGGHTGIVDYGPGDKGMVVMFYTKSEHHAAKSAEAGRPIYEDKTFVRIHPPGERLNVIDRPVKEEDSRRFPVQWNQFVQNKQQVPDGTPIDLLYPDHPSIGSMLRAAGVLTVEMCANLSGNAIDNVGMGAQRYVNYAKEYLAAANRGVSSTKLHAELEKRDREIRVLERTVENLTKQLNQVIAGKQAFAERDTQVAVAQELPRPVHLQKTGFDAQMEQLNASHGSRSILGDKKPEAPKAAKRQRPALQA